MDKNSMIGFIIGYYILFNPIMMTQSYSLIMGLIHSIIGILCCILVGIIFDK